MEVCEMLQFAKIISIFIYNLPYEIAIICAIFTKRKRRRILCGVLAVILLTVSILGRMFAVVEDAFFTFPTVEKALEYAEVSGDNAPYYTCEGEESFIFHYGDSKVGFLRKTQGGWKLVGMIESKTKGFSNKEGDVYLFVWNVKGMDDYYISVSFRSEITEISDSYGSVFVDQGTDYTSQHNYYTYVRNFDENYSFTADGITYHLTDFVVFS